MENRQEESKINFDQHPDKTVSDINNIINDAAKSFIPRGRQVYKCFWNNYVTRFKRDRDKLIDKAQETKVSKAVLQWRRSNATLKRERDQ